MIWRREKVLSTYLVDFRQNFRVTVEDFLEIPNPEVRYSDVLRKTLLLHLFKTLPDLRDLALMPHRAVPEVKVDIV